MVEQECRTCAHRHVVQRLNGEHFRRLREEMGLTLEQASALWGVSTAHLSKIERAAERSDARRHQFPASLVEKYEAAYRRWRKSGSEW